jgi:hypothetical protein
MCHKFVPTDWVIRTVGETSDGLSRHQKALIIGVYSFCLYHGLDFTDSPVLYSSALSKPGLAHQKHTGNTDPKGSLYDVYSPVCFWWTRRESNPRPEHLSTTFNEFYIYIISDSVVFVNVFLQVCQVFLFSLNKQLCAFTLNGNCNDNFIDWFASYFFKHFCIG